MSDIQDKKTTTFIRSKWVEWVFINLPFVCYLALLAIVYIYNAHASERSLRRIDALKKEVQDYNWQYQSLKQEITYGSIQSQLAKNLEELQLKPIGKAPKKLVGDNSDVKKK